MSPVRVPGRRLVLAAPLAVGLVLPGCLTGPQDGADDEADDAAGEAAAAAQAARVAEVEAMLLGRFDSSAQAAADQRYFAVQLRACPLDVPALGAVALYVEQAMLETPDQPYRQRVYVLSATDDVVESAVFELVQPERFVGLCDLDDAGRAAGSPGVDDVAVLPGCSVLLAPGDEGFVGSTDGASCLNDFRGATYATSEVTLTPTEIRSWDRGYDADDVQVWGAVAGPYVFVRQE
jgi:hypothetical protein